MQGREHKDAMQQHMARMREQHYALLWSQWLNMALGAWLLAGPVIFGYGFGPVVDPDIARVTADRGLPPPEVRDQWMAWSDVISGALIVLFAALALSPRRAWARWATTVVGLWLLFAPLVFWVPSAAAYANSTLVGALVIGFSILLPMMPGMSHAAASRYRCARSSPMPRRA